MITADSELMKLSAADRQIVESWLFEFDRDWHQGQLAEQVRKLPPLGSPVRLAALIELVKIDLERQWQHGRKALVEGYLRAYPELGTTDTAPADLILKEYEVRQAAGDSPREITFVKRFPHQAEQLRPLLEQAKLSGTRSQPALQSKETPRSDSPQQRTSHAPGVSPDLPERFGRYVIRKRLGQGGMGSVYLAHDTELDRDVALKVPHLSTADGPEVLERFYREARAAATLQHPCICPVYDVGQVDNIPYLTMSYIEGQPLSKIIERDKLLPQRKVAELVRKLALALQEAHAKGIVHRDLKPSNIMINQRGEPVVMDFGLVLRVDNAEARLTKSGSTLGTPAYMPPEQVRGATTEMGPACDIYSLGVILYELLSGQLPFEGPYMAVCAQILTQVAPPPSSHRPGVDPTLEAICRKAMAKNAERRYATMAEMAAALAAYLRVVTPSAQKPAPPRRKLPWLWAALSGAAALLAILAVIIIYQRTNYGTVKIELTDPPPGVEVKIDGNVVEVTGLGEPLRFKAGEHHLLQVSAKDFESRSESFTVKRGENAVLKVTLQPKQPPRFADRAAPTEPKTLADLLQPESIWEGEYEMVGDRKKGTLAVTIKKRNGELFEGAYVVANESGRWGWSIRGEVKTNTTVSWRFTALIEGNSSLGPTMNDRFVDGSFDGKKLSLFLRESNRQLVSDMWLKLKTEAKQFDTNDQPNAQQVAGAKAVNLLEIIDPRQHAILGNWQLTEGMLKSSGDTFCRLQLPYRPPEEYRLEIVAAQVKEGNNLAVILPVGNNQTSAILGGSGIYSDMIGLVLVDGKGLTRANGKWVWNDNETTRRRRVFTDATPRRLVYTVRRDSVQVTADDQTLIHWQGDPRRLGLIMDPKIDGRSLYIDTVDLIHITKIEITPLTRADKEAAAHSPEQAPIPSQPPGQAGPKEDYYTPPVAHEWMVMKDADGKPILATGCLSPDRLELAVWMGGSRQAMDVSIFRRSAVDKPFGALVRLNQSNNDESAIMPIFSADGLKLYTSMISRKPGDFNNKTMVASRRSTKEAFDAPQRVAGLPPVFGVGFVPSPNNLVGFCVPSADARTANEKKLLRAQREREGEPFQTQATNLPGWNEPILVGMNPIAVSDKGSLLFTWLHEGKVWLAASQTSGSAKAPLRLLDLKLKPVPYPMHYGQSESAPAIFISSDCRLLFTQLVPSYELAVMGLPPDVSKRVRDILDRPSTSAQGAIGGSATDSPVAAPARVDSTLEDLLQTGSVWTGKYENLVPSRSKGDLTIEITERKQSSFKGVYTLQSANGDRSQWTIDGEVIKENKVKWRFTKRLIGNQTEPLENFHVSGSYEDATLRLSLRFGEEFRSDMWVKLEKDLGTHGKVPKDEIKDFYGGGQPGEWIVVKDSEGNTLRHGNCSISPDSLELAVDNLGRSATHDIYILRRSSIDKPFGQIGNLMQSSSNEDANIPIFSPNGLELYTSHHRRQDAAGFDIAMMTSRRSKGEAFGRPRKVDSLPMITGNSLVVSPNGLYGFFTPANEKKLFRARRKSKVQPFRPQATNLPGWDSPIRAGINSVAASDTGALLFTWLNENKVWLAVSQTTGPATSYNQPIRLLDLRFTPVSSKYGIWVQPVTMSQDAGLLFSTSPERALVVMRVPEDVRVKILDILGRPKEQGQTDGATRAPVPAAPIPAAPARPQAKKGYYTPQVAPESSTVLFDGKDLSGWTTREGKAAEWKVEDGYMEVAPGKGDIMTKEKFGPDFMLHVEFWLPLMADAKDQARANSGVYLQGRYEIQVLDSYRNETYKGGECGAMFLLIPTRKNANKPPEHWQTYDITFHAPRVDDQGKVTKKGHVTVVFNGETVIDNGAFDKTTAGELDKNLGEPGPIRLQDHGCKVRFRNIWLKSLDAK